MKKLTNRLAALLVAAMAAGGSYAVGDDFKYALINNPAYPTTDLGVASINGVDEGLDPTGATDCTAKIQELLDKLANVKPEDADKTPPQEVGRGATHNTTGGVLYLPEGKYRIDGKIMMPMGTTIRGDWAKPVKGQAVNGTVIVVGSTYKGNDDEHNAVFTMQPSTQICNLSIFYEDQDPNSVSVYPPAIVYGHDGYFGNDYCNVRNVTLVNPYIGILFSSYNGGGCPNIFGLYGTPLYEGVLMDHIADVGRFDLIDFSPAYWAGAGLGTVYSESDIRNYTYTNGTGFVMRRNDWSYTCNYTVEGYYTAFRTEPTPDTKPNGNLNTDQGKPNGHNYGFNISDCKIGVNVTAASNSGIMFTRINVDDCENAVRYGGGAEGTVQFYDCDFNTTDTTVVMEIGASNPLVFKDCNMSGLVTALGGHLMADNCKFGGDVFIAESARTLLTGNTISGELSNNSLYESIVNDTVSYDKPLPEFKPEYMEIPVTKPAKEALFVVTDTKYDGGAQPVNTNIKTDPDGSILASAKDNTAAIQAALDEAGANGGGIVYLPSGHYRMNGNLNIPDGVELKGSSDIASVPRNNGAILEVFAGKGNENAEPFITMGKNSGLRGVTINYPEQTDPTNVLEYPYAVRGNEGVYIVNLALRATYKGVDLFTNKCDNHYVDYIAGHCFRNVVRVGGNSSNGIVSNIQCNTIAYAAGESVKYGLWNNSPEEDGPGNNQAYMQNKEDLDFLIVGDCTNEVLYNNFLFGCNKGVVFQNDGNGGATGIGLGNAVDGVVNTFVFNALKGDFPIINSQLVALNHLASGGEVILRDSAEARFITTGPDFKGNATFYSSNNWGGGNYYADVDGGTLNLVTAYMANPGAVYSFEVAEGAKLNMYSSVFKEMKQIVGEPGEDEKRISVFGSVVTPTGSFSEDFADFKRNLSIAWNLTLGEAFQSFNGWIASSNYNSGEVGNAIDGNATTRWATNGSQTPGQWFDLKNNEGQLVTMSALLLDATASPNDGPAAYEVEVYSRGEGWKKVAEGANGGAMLLIMFDEQARKVNEIRVTQTGTKNGYWSIHEMRWTDDWHIDQATDIEEVFDGSDGITFSDGVLYAGENDCVSVFAMDGVKKLETRGEETVSLNGLDGGIYLIAVKKPDGLVAKKVLLSK